METTQSADTPRLCPACDGSLQKFVNYCSWQCQVEAVKRSGGRVHTPNGLPIGCIMADGTMLEISHGDHPDYLFPVEVEAGPATDDMRADYELLTGEKPASDEDVRKIHGETHALIYTDGRIAVTLYECCYATWSVRTGEGRGKFVRDGQRLSEASRAQIRERRPNSSP